jgi:hypothetical protein
MPLILPFLIDREHGANLAASQVGEMTSYELSSDSSSFGQTVSWPFFFAVLSAAALAKKSSRTKHLTPQNQITNVYVSYRDLTCRLIHAELSCDG